MIQSTRGISNPLAATSVQRRIPDSALQNSKNVFVRFCCFCLPYPGGQYTFHAYEWTRPYMKVQNRDVDIVQEFSMVLDGVAARKEDNNLLLHMLFEEGEKEKEASV